MNDCHHEKVYSPNLLLTHPAQREWICRLCGAEGREADAGSAEAQRAAEEYRGLVEEQRRVASEPAPGAGAEGPD